MYLLCSRIILVFFSLFFVSCSNIAFPKFEVKECIFYEDRISISFSSNPNQFLFVQSFSLFEDSTKISGTYKFDDNIATFYPNEKIKENRIYEVTISKDLEDINGNSLDIEFTYEYSTKKETERPYIKSITPDNDKILSESLKEIIINFSETIDKVSFNDSFSISPTVKYICEFTNNNETVKILFLEELKYETRYVITINTELMDINRNTLLSEYKSNFYNHYDNKPPEYKLFYINDEEIYLSSEIKNQNIPLDCDINLQFDENIEIEYLSSKIDIQPSLNYTLKINKNRKDSALLILNEPVWNKEYKLTILNGISDVSGNSIKENTSYILNFNNEINRPVTVEKVFIDLFTDQYIEINNYDTLTFDVEKFPPTNETVTTNVFIIFDISSLATTIKEFSLMDSFGMDCTNSCFSSIIIRNINILDETILSEDLKLSSIINSIEFDNKKICVVKISIELINTINKGLININLKNNVYDNLNNKLLESISWVINKQ